MRARGVIGGAAAAIALVAALISGYGVEPSGVEEVGQAPTGLAEGTTLFFLDADGRLQPSAGHRPARNGSRRDSAADVRCLRVRDRDGAAQRRPGHEHQAGAEDAGDYVIIHLPFSRDDIGAAGIDQVICTAAGVVAASGREADAVEISAHPTHGGVVTRSCPVIG